MGTTSHATGPLHAVPATMRTRQEIGAARLAITLPGHDYQPLRMRTGAKQK
ncbi:MAG TPA: hypothetical protein VGI74_26645 [Streptosporangiaceae bacterium]